MFKGLQNSATFKGIKGIMEQYQFLIVRGECNVEQKLINFNRLKKAVERVRTYMAKDTHTHKVADSFKDLHT